MTSNRRGIEPHIKNINNQALGALTDLRYFKSLPTNIQLHLIKTLVIPILQYPPIQLITTSITNMIRLQKVQNAALRFAYNEFYPYTGGGWGG